MPPSSSISSFCVGIPHEGCDIEFFEVFRAYLMFNHIVHRLVEDIAFFELLHDLIAHAFGIMGKDVKSQ